MWRSVCGQRGCRWKCCVLWQGMCLVGNRLWQEDQEARDLLCAVTQGCLGCMAVWASHVRLSPTQGCLDSPRGTGPLLKVALSALATWQPS